jgi:hypothetical protein
MEEEYELFIIENQNNIHGYKDELKSYGLHYSKPHKGYINIAALSEQYRGFL